MAGTWYPAAVRLPITTQEFYKVRGVPTISIVEHITAGTDSRSWLQDANNGSSVHFLIRVENGRGVVYQFMPIEWAAWGNGRYSLNNPHMPQWIKNIIRDAPTVRAASDAILKSTISIEHEGRVPTAELYTGPMLTATKALNKWLADTVPTIMVDRAHIIGHYQIDHVNRPFCPGGAGGALFPFEEVIAAMQHEPTSDVKLQNYFGMHGANRNAGALLKPTHKRVLEDGQEWDVRIYERWMIHTKAGQGVFEGRLGFYWLEAIGEL